MKKLQFKNNSFLRAGLIWTSILLGVTSAYNQGASVLPGSFPPSLLSNMLAPCAGNPGDIGGTVFVDNNNNGANDGEPGQQDIIVSVFASDGTEVAGSPVTTDASGQWTIIGLDETMQYRVEFTFPASLAHLRPGVTGTNNGTDVQIVTPTTCNVDFGVIDPSSFISTNQFLATPCYINGDNTGTEEVFVKWSYANEGTAPGDKTAITVANQAATMWGVAFNPYDGLLYGAATLKRHVGLYEGADGGGLDAIFVVDPFNGTSNASLWLELTDDLGINVGTISDNATRGLGAPPDPSQDPEAFDKIGKVGIGDIELSQDGSTLYVMNLFDKTVYAIDVATKTVAASYLVPDPGCTNGTYRPWALSIRNGQLFAGSVCDGSTTTLAMLPPNLTDDSARPFLSANVYRLDGGSFTNVLSFGLDYAREAPWGYSGGTCTDDADGWYGWVSDLPATCEPEGIVYPQPILSDIEFDDSGNMILGFLDRTGFQVGVNNYGPNDTNLYGNYVGGDILYACNSGGISGSWTIENPSTCTNSNGEALGTTNNTYPGYIFGGAPWPNIGEFFIGDFFSNNGTLTAPDWKPGHAEITIGGLAVLPGSNEVVSTAYDPVTASGDLFGRGGVIKLSLTSGRRTVQGYQVYSDTDTGTFGKGVGLGDLELFGDRPTLQIGNVIWEDADMDGVYDSNELPVSGVPVSLYNVSTGMFEALATSDGNGQFYFSNVSSYTNYQLVIGYDYTLAAADGLWDPTGMTISLAGTDYVLTTPDNSGEGATDNNDSDATVQDGAGLTGYPIIAYMTADSSDFSLDVGLFAPPCTIDADGLANLECAGNDAIVFELTPTGTGVSASYAVSVSGGGATSITPTSGNYGEATIFLLNDMSAGAGDVTLTITDALGCSRDVLLTDPGTCLPLDPTGYFYCVETGQIITGGSVSVTPPPGGSVINFDDGADGSYAFDVIGAGTYTIVVTVPPGYTFDPSTQQASPLDPTGQPNPYAVGSNSADGMFMDDFSAAANPFYNQITFESGDPNVILNNIALLGCCTLTDAGLTNVACGDNDALSFELSPTGSGLSGTYSVSVSGGAASSVSPTTATYGSSTTFTLNDNTAGNGDVTITITDTDDPACTLDVLLTDPGSCACTLEAGIGQTLCSSQTLSLADLGASVNPATLTATWTTSGTGLFDDTNTSSGVFGTATTYTPSAADIAAGEVVLQLTITDTSVPGCTGLTDEVTITIQRVDCGAFPWTGSN